MKAKLASVIFFILTIVLGSVLLLGSIGYLGSLVPDAVLSYTPYFELAVLLILLAIALIHFSKQKVDSGRQM